MWVKHKNQTFQITEWNIMENKETKLWELWVQKTSGRGIKLVSFTKEYVEEYNGMFDAALKANMKATGQHIVEV